MVDEVRQARGNAVVDFKYGQRSTFWTTILGIDDVSWYGSGMICRLPEALLQRLLSENS